MSVLTGPLHRTTDLPRLPILASLSVLDALEPCGLPIRVKWPNDLKVGERKVAGILAESRTEGSRIPWAVVGFGVNLARPDDQIPEEIREKIAFLGDFTVELTRDRVAAGIVQALRGLVECIGDEDSWKAAMERWSHSASWDVPCVHRHGDREIRGLPVRLADDGGLVLRTDQGEVTVYSGEIIDTVQGPGSRVQG
jgi:BirA family biotin operon repressor/biotin-[acetyl-CoA-carboxylase] ligase